MIKAENDQNKSPEESMDATTARALVNKVLDLLDLCTQLEATGHHVPNLSSPEEVWQIDKAVFNKQVEIVKMLDSHVFNEPIPKNQRLGIGQGRFTTHMSSGHITAHLMPAVVSLYHHCAKTRTLPNSDTNSIKHSQQRIAETLDPKAVRVAAGKE